LEEIISYVFFNMSRKADIDKENARLSLLWYVSKFLRVASFHGNLEPILDKPTYAALYDSTETYYK